MKRYVAALQRIRALAESCARQLAGWAGAVDKLPFAGRRQLPEKERQSRQTAQQSRDFRLNFLRPDHPLYNSSEARAAWGEAVE